MARRSRYLIPALGALLVLAGIAAHFLTAPERILEAVRIVDEDNRPVVEIDFAVPVRQEGVIPETGVGALVQVKLRTPVIAGGERNEYLGRASLIGGDRRVPLTDVAYEAQVPGGPLLTLRFERPVRFHLDERDGRTRLRLVIEEAPPGAG